MDYFIQTYTGSLFDFEAPKTIEFVDIARSLSRIPRFGGHTNYPLSVAEHSHAVMEIVATLGGSQAQQMVALLHDAHEAYTGDITLPLKKFLLDRYHVDVNGLCKQIQTTIETALKVPQLAPCERQLIKDADQIALTVEHRLFMTGNHPWSTDLPDVPMDYDGFYGNWDSESAYEYFDKAYGNLRRSLDFETRVAINE